MSVEGGLKEEYGSGGWDGRHERWREGGGKMEGGQIGGIEGKVE